MATTEITKILFRRGTSNDRFALEGLGGLAQGEPGFTSSEGGTFGNDNTGDNYNQDSAFLNSDDATQLAPGGNQHGGALGKSGGGDFFIGGGGNADIFIGGTSAERHWQRYFVSKYGTDFNHPNAYIDGPLTVGESGTNTTNNRAQNYKNHAWHVNFYGENGETSWNAQTGLFEVTSTAALKVPTGATGTRPANNDSGGVGTSANGTLGNKKGYLRFNTDLNSFEGYNGATWNTFGSGVFGDLDNNTYITCESNQPAAKAEKGTTGMIKFVVGTGSGNVTPTLAGYFDNSRNLHVAQDILAYSSSDQRQKDNARVIENPIEKTKTLHGVEFEWNDKAPAWVQENRNDIGLLAQEVEAVLPQAVTTRDDGYKAVDYKKVIPLLVESIKALTARVEELESR